MSADLQREGRSSSTQEELETYETKIAENLDSPARRQLVAEALSDIHQKKLYLETGLKTFEVYVKTRWGMSRSRAYQIIRFVKQRNVAALSGKPIPMNERQSRKRQNLIDDPLPFEKRWTPVFKYLDRRFLDCPPDERHRFVKTLEVATRLFASRVQQSREESERKSDAEGVTELESARSNSPRKIFQNEAN